MGSSSSKFRKYVQNGDEYAALQIFQNSFELQHSLDPNSSYGDSLQHNTPLHLAAQHAMKSLLRTFLCELKGNPCKKNSAGETALHLVCQGDLVKHSGNQEKRSVCLNLILQWRKSGKDGEKIDLDCADNEGNTPLHFAAASGLKKCVEILVSHGASLSIENNTSETVCDLAQKNKHIEIAQFLELKMLFNPGSSEDIPVEDTDHNPVEEVDIRGLRAQDLQEAKDQLLVETSDMFHVPLFSAEVLLRNNEWSRQTLLDAWMKDPVTCCKEAGISAPSSDFLLTSSDSFSEISKRKQDEDESIITSSDNIFTAKDKIACDICSLDILSEEFIHIPCTHHFCKDCWKVYLTEKILNGEAHNILCPAFGCGYVVPVDVIERVVSPDMVKRYLHFDIKAFVESNPTMKWCPHPGCARAVQLPEPIEKVSNLILAISFTVPPALSHSVDCGNGHYFCWECLGLAHAPCGCEKWNEWHAKIAEIKPQELKNAYAESEEAENSLWMVTNSKPCSNCKSPIQRNEGCNHMKCLKCKHEFCWVCMESWKKHGLSTGGYFRCNRIEAVKKTEVKTEALKTQAEERSKHMQELKRFLQYYTRFTKHEKSFKLEESFIKTIHDKMSTLETILATESSFASSADEDKRDVSFLEEAIYELLRARQIMCGAYVYGFYLEDNGYTKNIFEYLQNELEEVTEKLSEMIIRTYLQTSASKIIQMTSLVKRKRLDLLNAVHKGLIPPETPPSLRKKRRHRMPGLLGLDPLEDVSPLYMKTLLDSVENMDPNNPWVINQYGKHTNVAALCDWPDYDSEDETKPPNPVLVSVLGECSREGCRRPRVKNQRTGEIHNYCCLNCKHWEVLKASENHKVTATIDPVIEQLIAFELAKLQESPTVQTNSTDGAESFLAVLHDVEMTNTNLLDDKENDADPSAELTCCSTSFDEFSTSAGEVDETFGDNPKSSSEEAVPLEDISDTKSFNNVFHHPLTNDFGTNQIDFYVKHWDVENSRNVNVPMGEEFSKANKELLFRDLKSVS